MSVHFAVATVSRASGSFGRGMRAQGLAGRYLPASLYRVMSPEHSSAREVIN
jgi:hypothetical protein